MNHSHSAVRLQENLKRNFVMDRLTSLGVTESQSCKKLSDLTYDELKFELVLAEFHQIDVGNSENRWF